MLQRIDNHLTNPWSSVIFSHVNSKLNIFEVKSSFKNKCTDQKKHHNTEKKLDVKKKFTAIVSFVVNPVQDPDVYFTVKGNV